MLGQLPRHHFAAVDVASRIASDTVRGAGAFHLERVGDAEEEFAALQLANADAAQPAGVRGDAVRFGVGYIHEAVAQGNAARASELLPLCDEGSLLVEDLNAVVAAVGDEEATLRVQGDVVRGLELDRAGAKPPERADEFAILREARDAPDSPCGRVGLLARMPFGDEEISVRGHNDAAGLVERAVLRIASDAGPAKRHEDVPVGVELGDGVADGARVRILETLALIHGTHVDNPYVAVAVLIDLVREDE